MHLPPESDEKNFARCKYFTDWNQPENIVQDSTYDRGTLCHRLQFICLAWMDETSENRGADGQTGPVEKGSTEIVAVISNMSSLLAKSLATLHSTMTKSFNDIKASLNQLTVEEIHGGSLNADAPGTKCAKNDSGKQQDSSQQSGSCINKDSCSIDQQSGATEKRGQDLLLKGSDALNDSQHPSEEIEALAGIADTFKLDEKKVPAVNE